MDTISPANFSNVETIIDQEEPTLAYSPTSNEKIQERNRTAQWVFNDGTPSVIGRKTSRSFVQDKKQKAFPIKISWKPEYDPAAPITDSEKLYRGHALIFEYMSNLYIATALHNVAIKKGFLLDKITSRHSVPLPLEERIAALKPQNPILTRKAFRRGERRWKSGFDLHIVGVTDNKDTVRFMLAELEEIKLSVDPKNPIDVANAELDDVGMYVFRPHTDTAEPKLLGSPGHYTLLTGKLIEVYSTHVIHTINTKEGFSGSAIFSLKTGKLIAIHAGGAEGHGNWAFLPIAWFTIRSEVESYISGNEEEFEDDEKELDQVEEMDVSD